MSDEESGTDEEPGTAEVDDAEVDDAAVEVSRAEARSARSDAQRRKKMIWGGVAAAVAVVVALVIALVATSGDDRPTVPTTTSTTTSTTTTSTTTTIAPDLATAAMPLTGVPVDGEDPAVAAVMEAPALAVKIDNDPLSQPYVGINGADIVIELRVEGISRNIAVFHSTTPEVVGAVRSARTSDPDLLAMLVKPLFAASGGNPTVIKMVNSTPWIVVADHGAAQADYFRLKGRRAPHNLMIRAADLRERIGGGEAPQQIFEYVPHDEVPAGVPQTRIRTSVGASRADFDWDQDLGKWIRMDPKGPRLDDDGEPVASTNVVVLATEYGRSGADRRSPEARSVGEGNAWVFADGKVTAGRWTRTERGQPWVLTADDGSVMRLVPGNTWVLLPDPSAGTPVAG